MPRNKIIYSKDLNYSYIIGPNGEQLGGTEGDQTQNPWYLDSATSKTMNMDPVYTPTTIPSKVAQMGKDFVVNAAAQAPLSFIPGAGPLATVARLGGSTLTGYGMDSLLNPNKSSEEKLLNAGLNTTIGELVPWLIEKGAGFKLPGKTTTTTAIREAEPTVSEGITSRTTSGTSKGTSKSSGISNTTSKGSTASEGSGTTTGQFESTSTRLPYKGEITPEMQDIINKIEGFKTKLEGSNNKSQITQLKNVISKYEDVLAAHQDLQEGTITHTTGSRSGSSTNTQQSEHTNINQGNTSSQSSNEGTMQSTGSTQATRTTIPGASTTQTTSETRGNNMLERIMEGILDAHRTTTNQLTKLKDFMYGTAAQDVKSAIDDATRK